MFNDRKAPRFNPRKFRSNILTKELYQKWKEDNQRKESFSEFRKIWEEIARTYIQEITENTDGARLGAGLGDLYMGYVPKAKKRGKDFILSEEYNKEIKHENWESSGKLGKIIYAVKNRKYIYRLHGWWGFKGSRYFKNMASKNFRENPSRYKNTIEKRNLTNEYSSINFRSKKSTKDQ